MKNITALLTLVLSLGAFAQETVELTSKKVSVNSASATLVRTNKTPGTVDVSFQVPLDRQVCERYETRYVVRTDGARCGYNTHRRRVYVGKVCVQKRPDNVCVRWADQYRTQTVRIPRTCSVPETYCAQYGTRIQVIKDTMRLKFKDLPALGDSEADTFVVSGRQKNYDGSNVVYTVTPAETVRPYKVSQKKILFLKIDSYVVEEK